VRTRLEGEPGGVDLGLGYPITPDMRTRQTQDLYPLSGSWDSAPSSEPHAMGSPDEVAQTDRDVPFPGHDQMDTARLGSG
jgi:hypothetical protein